MSIFDDLEDIAESWTYRGRIHTGPRAKCSKPATEVCRNGHVRTEQNTKRRGGQRTCLDCKRASYGFKGIYKPRKQHER